MVSFTAHAISIERLPSKTKIGKVSLYFHISCLCKPDFSSAINNFFSLLKPQKVTSLQQVTGCFALKTMVEHFLEIQTLKDILEFQG